MIASIKIVNAALDETSGGEIILRGVIDPDSFPLLKVDGYQREALPLTSLPELVAAFERGSVPDIDLGMRGEGFTERNGCFYLKDSVYIVDGLQRVTAARAIMERQTGVQPHLGAVIHFNTTEAWERARFRILNQDRRKLSPNVLLRNLQHDNAAIRLLYGLTTNKSFVLHGRVAWNQQMLREELITAATYVKVVGFLHAHYGGTQYSETNRLARGLLTLKNTIGEGVMRDNVRTFFELVDECWGIKRIAFKGGAIHMRYAFLTALARVLSQHTDFWKDDRLFIEASLRRKLAQFPTDDPTVINLSSANGTARNMLYMLMVEHINSGKRTRRLKPRVNDYTGMPAGGDEEE
ncbi:MAG: hypothetical protein WBB39_01440 [Candidatus Saccharimonadales bacterium]